MYEVQAQADIEVAPTGVQDEACVLLLRRGGRTLWLGGPVDVNAAAGVTPEGFVVKHQMKRHCFSRQVRQPGH